MPHERFRYPATACRVQRSKGAISTRKNYPHRARLHILAGGSLHAVQPEVLNELLMAHTKGPNTHSVAMMATTYRIAFDRRFEFIHNKFSIPLIQTLSHLLKEHGYDDRYHDEVENAHRPSRGQNQKTESW